MRWSGQSQRQPHRQAVRKTVTFAFVSFRSTGFSLLPLPLQQTSSVRICRTASAVARSAVNVSIPPTLAKPPWANVTLDAGITPSIRHLLQTATQVRNTTHVHEVADRFYVVFHHRAGLDVRRLG